MPSPRAVLSDIHDLNLDPTVSHRNIKASGRLATPRASVVLEVIPEATITEVIPETVPVVVEVVPEAPVVTEVIPEAPMVISVAIKSSSKTSTTPKNALVNSAKVVIDD